MKIFQVAIALLMAQFGISVAAPKAFEDLSAADLAALNSELIKWKFSAAGQQAVKDGFVPTPNAASSPIHDSVVIAPASNNDLLKRLYNAKLAIANVQTTQHNAVFGTSTPFALMTPEEFSAFLNRGKPNFAPIPAKSSAPANTTHARRLRQTGNPTSIDWVALGKVTSVRSQGSCGSCVDFAVVAAIESGYAVATNGALPSLSEQNLVSCSEMQGDCNYGGNNFDKVFSWVINNNGGGVCTSSSFPYTADDGSKVSCQQCTKQDLGMVGYIENSFEDADDLEDIVAKQPVAAAINADIFQYYQSGIIMGDEAQYPSSHINHAVEIVGYGVDDRTKTKYWKAKNSWGTTFGENGFFRIEKGYPGATYGAGGIENDCGYPVFRDHPVSVPAPERCPPTRVGYKTIGQSLMDVWPGTNVSCCDKCRATPGCVAANWETNAQYCRLMSSITGEQPASWMSTTRIVPKATTDAQCLQTEVNTDYGYNDIVMLKARNAADCCDRCNQNDLCSAYTFNTAGYCYLKTVRGSNIWHYSNKADGTPVCISGESYKCQTMKSGVQFIGQDLSQASSPSASSCCGICRSTSGCAAFTWTNDYGGTCYLKSGSSNPVALAGALSATVY